MSKTIKLTERTWQKVKAVINDQSPDKTHLLGKIVKNHNTVLVVPGYGSFAADVPQFGIVDPFYSEMTVTDPDTFEQVPGPAFFQDTVLRVRPPGNWNDNQQRFGGFLITCEPMMRPASSSDKKPIKAWYSGYCPVRIDVRDHNHGFADVITEPEPETGYLKSTRTGPCRIIWKESGTGLKWAIVYHSGLNASHYQPSFAFIKLTNVELHPMKGRVQCWNRDTEQLDTEYPNTDVDVYRYPTYTNNDLYEVNNIVAAVRVDDGKYIALHTIPIQFAVQTHTQP